MSPNNECLTNQVAPPCELDAVERILTTVAGPITHQLVTLLPGSGIDWKDARCNARAVIIDSLRTDPQFSFEELEGRRRLLQGILGGFSRSSSRPESSSPPGSASYHRLVREVLAVNYKSNDLLDALVVQQFTREKVAELYRIRNGREVTSALAMTASILSMRYQYGLLAEARAEIRPQDPSSDGRQRRTDHPLPRPRVEERTPQVTSATQESPTQSMKLPPLIPGPYSSSSIVSRVVNQLQRHAETLDGVARDGAKKVLDAMDAFRELSSVARDWKEWLQLLNSDRIGGLLKFVSEQIDRKTLEAMEPKVAADVIVSSGSRRVLSSQLRERDDSPHIPFESRVTELESRVLSLLQSAVDSLALKNGPSADFERFSGAVRDVRTFLENQVERFRAQNEVLRTEAQSNSIEELRRLISAVSPDVEKISDLAEPETFPEVISSSPLASAEDDKDDELDYIPARQTVVSFSTSHDLQNGGDSNDIFDGLMNARRADWCRLQFEDGREMEGAIIFNEFTGSGRLINIDEEFSFDFSREQVVSVKY